MERHTTRLTLDALRPDATDALFRYRANPSVSRYQGWRPASVDEARAFIGSTGATLLDHRERGLSEPSAGAAPLR